MPQVQILVEKDKNVNFKHALELAASVLPMKVEANTLEDVRIKSTPLAIERRHILFSHLQVVNHHLKIVGDIINCSIVSRCINLLLEDWNSYWFVQLS